MLVKSLVGVIVVGTATAAVAQPEPEAAQPVVEQPAATTPEWLSRVELGGVAFLSYRYELTDGAGGANEFDVDRMYLFAKIKPADHVKFRMTLDAPGREAVVSVSDDGMTVDKEAGRLDIVLKHAYLELYDLPAKGLSFKFGMHDLPWVPFEEKIWSYRFQGTVFADREGYLSSTDLGVGASWAPAAWGELHVSIVDGETWSRPEVSKHKDVHARVSVTPLPESSALRGLALNVFASAGLYDEGDDQTRRRLIPQLAFQHARGAVAVEYFRAWDPPARLASKHPSLTMSTDAIASAQGASAFGWLDLGALGLPAGLRVMGRVDWLDPDTGLADNSHTREIVGVGYRANANVQVLIDGELVQYDAGAEIANDERRMFVHTLVGF